MTSLWMAERRKARDKWGGNKEVENKQEGVFATMVSLAVGHIVDGACHASMLQAKKSQSSLALEASNTVIGG